MLCTCVTPLFLSGEHWSLVQRYFLHLFVIFRCSALRNTVIHLFVLLLMSLFKIFLVLKSMSDTFTSNQNKHDVFRSVSDAARDFPGSIRHRDLLNALGQYRHLSSPIISTQSFLILLYLVISSVVLSIASLFRTPLNLDVL
jgi:hypothetical protein